MTRRPSHERERRGRGPCPCFDYDALPVIYDQLEQIQARKGPRSLFAGERFAHRFGPGARVLGLPNGDLLVTSVRGRRLWREFDFPDD